MRSFRMMNVKPVTGPTPYIALTALTLAISTAIPAATQAQHSARIVPEARQSHATYAMAPDMIRLHARIVAEPVTVRPVAAAEWKQWKMAMRGHATIATATVIAPTGM